MEEQNLGINYTCENTNNKRNQIPTAVILPMETLIFTLPIRRLSSTPHPLPKNKNKKKKTFHRINPDHPSIHLHPHPQQQHHAILYIFKCTITPLVNKGKYIFFQPGRIWSAKNADRHRPRFFFATVGYLDH